MSALAEFRDILTENEPLGSLTSLGVGGSAQWMARPRGQDELVFLVKRCQAEGIPWRVFGGGSNVLVPDEGVQGVVIRMTQPVFSQVRVEGCRVTSGAGARLSDLIATACQSSLSGLEPLVGIPGTVGGAIQRNAGSKTGDIGQYIYWVELLDPECDVAQRMRADIRFGYRHCNLDDCVILSACLELIEDDPESIVRRIKKIWIAKKASQPFAFQSAAYVFRNPRGLSAVELIDNAELRGTKVGGAEISTRDPTFILAHPGATSRDVLRLVDLVRSRVQEQTGVAIELQLDLW